MKRQAIEKALWRAAAGLPRPDFEKIRSADVEPMVRHDYVTLQDKKKAAQPLRRVIAAAACALVLLAGAAIGGWFYNYRVADAVVDIDMNPSYEIVVNRAQRVLAVNPLNADAFAALEGREYRGWDVEEAVYTLFTGISDHGLITPGRPAILVSVEGKNQRRAAELEQKVTHTIDMFMLGTDASPNIVTQRLSAEDELRQAARGYGVSPGKMQLVRGLLEKNVLFTEEELAAMRLETLIDLAIAYALQDLDTADYIPPMGKPAVSSSAPSPPPSSSSSAAPPASSQPPAPASTPTPTPAPTPAPTPPADSGHTPAAPADSPNNSPNTPSNSPNNSPNAPDDEGDSGGS